MYTCTDLQVFGGILMYSAVINKQLGPSDLQWRHAILNLGDRVRLGIRFGIRD
jgi:hypothetical protein